MSAPDDNDEICDICKEMVKEARDQLLSNMTQEEIKEVFEGSCKLIPVKLIAEGCIKIVDEIIPQLIEMLASRMDPNMVCTVSGLCNAAHLPEENHILKFLRLVLLKHKDSQCTECTTMITDVQTFLKSTSESDVKKYIEKFCSEKMPSYLCDIVVGEYFSSIYNYISSNTPIKVCSSVGICPQKCDFNDRKSKVNDELTCEFCEHVLQHVKDLITTNTTVEEFRTALLNFCKHVGSFSNECTKLVDDYYDMLFDYIRNLDTKGMCTLMGLCNNDMCSKTPLVKLIPALETKNRIPLIKLQPAEKIVKEFNNYPLVRLMPADVFSKKQMKESNDIFQDQLPLERLIHPLSVFEQDTECALCKAFSFYLETDLAGDKSKENVKKALDGVCDKWMVDFPDHCRHLLNKYSMKIRLSIAKDVPFSELCTSVKACLVENKKPELNVKVVPKIGDGPFCELCKDAMAEVEKQLSDPATKQKLKDAFDQACNILPKELRDDCTNFINSNIDAVIDILQQELQPDNICPALGLCQTLIRTIPPRIKDLECDLCKDVVTSFRQKMEDPSSKKMILTFIEEGCARLPVSLAADCKNFFDENIDTVIAIIVEELDPDTVCSMLKICPASMKKEKLMQSNDVECDLCKEVVGKVLDLVKAEKTEAKVKAALEKVCSYFPSLIATKCENFVDVYTDVLIQLLLQEMDPSVVCAALNICPASLKKETPLRANDDLECDLCSKVVTKVDAMIKEKKSEEEIRVDLMKVCSYLPSSMAATCEHFVSQYTDLLITLLAKEMDPSSVCAALKMCPASLKKEKPRRIKDDLECDLCKEVVSKLDGMIEDKRSKEEIKNALDKVCSYLPSSISTKCENFVNKYTDLLITLLAEEMDPDMVCAALGICPEKVLVAEQLSKAVDVECQLCQYMLHFLQEKLMDPTAQEKLKDVLKKVCNILPDTYEKNCEAFVDEYGSSVLVLIAQEIDPSVRCSEFKMCSNQTKMFLKPELVGFKHFEIDDCSVCTTVVDYLDKLLEEDDVDKEITKLAEKICTVLPTSLEEKCRTILETYGPYILQMIGQVADSKEVCQEIDLCARPPGHVHIVGGNKCTFGPSYWCKSSAHATACKAENFCQTKVWKN